MTHNMTSGPITPLLVRFTIPLVLGNLFQLTYNAADSVIVGRFVGEDALAAVGTSNPLMTLAILFINGMCLGAGILVSNAFGAQDTDRLEKQVSTTAIAGGAFSLAFSLLCILLATPLLRLMQVPDEVLPIAVAYLQVVFAGLIFTFFLRIVTVSGTSMYPNYHDGDRLIVTNTFGQPLEQGDVVVLVNVLDEPIIKRVIATENQEVDIDFETGTVYVDGQALDESQFGLENGITTATSTMLEKTEFPTTVPEGHIFVLGDNRPVSEDSRYTAVGMVSVENVLGKAEFRLFPFDRFGTVE